MNLETTEAGMTIHLKRITLFAAVLAVLAAGCGNKTVPPTSVLDTPEYHYRNGLKYLDSNQIDEAMKSFDRAVAIAPKSPLGYIGKGLAFGSRLSFRCPLQQRPHPNRLWTTLTLERPLQTALTLTK